MEEERRGGGKGVMEYERGGESVEEGRGERK